MQRDDYHATLLVMLGLAAATLTGFGREAALAHQLGATRAADVFLVAFALPEFFFISLPIVLSPAFLPLFADVRQRRGAAAAWRLARRVALAVLLVLLAATVLLGLGLPLILPWLAPGFAAAERHQAADAVYRMLPAISLMGVAVLAGAVLQVYRRFFRPALATAAYNLAFVASLLALPLGWAVGRAAWGVSLGAAAALLIQVPLLWHLRPASRRDPEPAPAHPASVGVRDVARLAGPLAAAYAVHHAILLVDRAMATTLNAGGVAILNYAYRLALVIGQLSGVAVSTAVFPRMAEQVAAGDQPGLRASLAAALRFVWLVGLPATAGLIVLRRPIVQALFERGAFAPSATTAVSQVLVWYALAILADALCQPLWRVVYARRGAWTVLAVNALQTAIRLALNVALIQSFGYNGLALSAALGLGLQLVVLGLWVRRQVGAYLTRAWWRAALRVGVAVGLAVLVTHGVASQLAPWPATIVLVAGGGLGTLTYLLTLRLLPR